MPSDFECESMLRFQNGDEDGFLEILDRYEKPLINFCYGYTGDIFSAEDIAQDVFVEIYSSKGKYRPAGKFSSWVYTIAAHKCLNFKKQRYRSVSIEDDLSDSTPSIENEMISGELEGRVRSALAALPNQQRVALLLSKYNQMSLDEIAESLKTSVGAVKQLIFRAKDNLKNLLKKDHDIYES